MTDALTALKPFIATVAAGQSLDFAAAQQAFGLIMDGQATPAQMAAFLVALRMRGETVDEIAAAASVISRMSANSAEPACTRPTANDIRGTCLGPSGRSKRRYPRSRSRKE